MARVRKAFVDFVDAIESRVPSHARAVVRLEQDVRQQGSACGAILTWIGDTLVDVVAGQSPVCSLVADKARAAMGARPGVRTRRKLGAVVFVQGARVDLCGAVVAAPPNGATRAIIALAAVGGDLIDAGGAVLARAGEALVDVVGAVGAIVAVVARAGVQGK